VTRRDPRALLVCVVAAAGAGLLGFDTLPVVLGAIVDGLGLDAGGAGKIASLELGGMAVAALVLAPRVSGVSLRGLALVAAGIAAAAHAISMLVEGFAALAVLRAIAGLAEGALVAAGNALIATSVDPDRLAARMQIVAGSAGALLLVVLPHVVAIGGHRGAFGLMALIVLACMPLLAWMPRGASARTSRPHLPVHGRALPVLAAGLVLTAGESAVWAFLERIGLRAGVSPPSIGALLGAITLLGLLGAALAAWLGTRLGRRLPIGVGIAFQAAACWSIAHADVTPAYVLGCIGYGLSFFFVQPYLLGTAAVVDPDGRVAAGYAGVVLVGGAIGPASGGALVEAFSYEALGWQILAASAVALAAIWPLAVRLDRASSSSAIREPTSLPQ
jgi:predicted MFS family arabinose efflux permease